MIIIEEKGKVRRKGRRNKRWEREGEREGRSATCNVLTFIAGCEWTLNLTPVPPPVPPPPPPTLR